ncbi:MAG: hypothetical protein QOK40_2672 [Miltoncostaeaceae bacterium]|nr:hypothetical protein [Miltoncostaeaceae bacterium]
MRRHGVARPAVRLTLSDGQSYFAGALEPLDHPGLVRLVPPGSVADPPRIVVIAVAAVTRFEVIAEGPPWTGRRSPGE